MPHALATAPPMPALLRGVSRSFYVSIRLLPPQLRRPIAVAYLLARASDTLADAADLAPAQKLEQLDTWAAAIDGSLSGPVAAAGLAATFEQVRHHAGERELMAALPWCLSWLEELAPADRDDVRAVLGHITRGQKLDVERFGQGSGTVALDSPEQLEDYTYLVAGCVGEFWTDLCLRHLPGFARLPGHQMRELGREYGRGLQLVNILRDAGEDLADGRCYFPEGELAAIGLGPQDILGNPDRFEAVWNHWQARARHGLALGMRYAGAINSRRVRAASALPALLGARTLALLRSAGPQRLQVKVKMPRSEVRSMMARLAVTLAGRAPLHALFARLQGPASDGWDNPAP